MSNENIDLTEVDVLVDAIGKKQENIVSLLHALQDKFNYLPLSALMRLSEITEISPSVIAGVSSFYAQFRTKPAGRHSIKICTGTACHLKGAEDLYEQFKKVLKITSSEEDTDEDGLFTISRVACLGCCMLAPAVMIDNITYGPVMKDNILNILKDFLDSGNSKKRPLKITNC